MGPKLKLISFRVPPLELTVWKRVALRQGKTLSDWIREAIRTAAAAGATPTELAELRELVDFDRTYRTNPRPATRSTQTSIPGTERAGRPPTSATPSTPPPASPKSEAA